MTDSDNEITQLLRQIGAAPGAQHEALERLPLVYRQLRRSVSHSAPTAGACCVPFSLVPVVSFGGGIIAGNSIILLLAWRASAVTQDLLVAMVIMSVIMAAVGVLACAAPARRALRVHRLRRCGRVDVSLGTSGIGRRPRKLE